MSATEKREVRWLVKGWYRCHEVGHHLFQRDYIFGVIPVGRPYCMWCGAERAASQHTEATQQETAT